MMDLGNSEDGGKKKKVLIVDDEKNFVKLLRFNLEERGFECYEAYDGRTAIDQAVANRPDLILLDLLLPEMTGVEVCSSLKKNFLTSQIPVIMITVKTDYHDKILAFEEGVDDFISKPFQLEEFGARINMILRRMEKSLSSNPLTRLPGNVSINTEIDRRIREKAKFALAYLDLDNFKPYNDHYGYVRGDAVIRRVSEILLDAIECEGSRNDFIGHIGGDDFVFITHPKRVKKVSEEIIRRFEEILPDIYEEKDLERGYIELPDRRGKIVKHPILSLSIGVATNVYMEIGSHIRAAEVATEMKSFAKTFPGSVVKIDQRRS
jgi:diguanylate cyclase (GGDEF)-like protein